MSIEPADRHRPGPARVPALWHGLVLIALLLGLVPLDPDSALSAPGLARDPGGPLRDVLQQAYLFIKALILWVPLGMLAGLMGARGPWPGRLALALLAAMLFIVLPLLPDPRARDLLEVLALLPGLAAGYALGRRTRRGAEVLPRMEMHPSSAEAVLPDVASPCDVAAPVTDDTAKRSSATRSQHGRSDRHASRSGARRSGSASHSHAGLAARLFAFVPLALAGFALIDFPRGPMFLALLLLAYTGVLLKWPRAWLVVVPAALPLLDLAPWTGRFFLDEFDLLMLATAGGLLLGGHGRRGAPIAAWPLLALWFATLAISALLGLGAPPPLDANAFSSYWSPYNSLRLAKGFIWGVLIFLWIRQERLEPDRLGRLLALGMGLGLLGVGLVGLWERWLFAGFADSGHAYRIVSTFSSMHTGGGHIEAYLAAALPFLWLGLARLRTAFLVIPLMALTVYVTIFTVARGGVLALGVVLLVLAVASLRLAWRERRRAMAVPSIAVLALLALGLATGISGGYFQHRLAQTAQDWQIRVDHWNRAISMMDGTPMAQMFGMGLGSFPRVYLERGPADKQVATYGFASTRDGDTHLRLGGGDTLYYAQRVAVTAGQTYRLQLDARGRQGAARIETPVCEKQLLNSRRCVWLAFDLPGDGQWHHLSREFTSGEVGERDGLRRPPVELFLHQPGRSGVVDVDNLKLFGPDGRELLCNGDFSRGGDCWFFKTHSHLPWHIKNVWVHSLFEQGWLGLLLFAGVVSLALYRLAQAAWNGRRLAWVWLASLLGLLSVGLFDSLLDAPRLAALLVALILLGIGHDWGLPGRSARRRSRPPHHSRAAPLDVTPPDSGH